MSFSRYIIILRKLANKLPFILV